MRCMFLIFLLLATLPTHSSAAIALIAPSDDIVGPGEETALVLQVGVVDPGATAGAEMPPPQRFGVQHLGEQSDLRVTLKAAGSTPNTLHGPAAGFARYVARRPGDYTFYLESPPRWSAADEQFTTLFAKLCVNVLALEEGWDEPVGLEAEIVPLSRPYGLWSGNLFSGQVLLDGDLAPYAEVAVVFLGTDPAAPATLAVPAAPYLVQKLRADAGGVFHYAMPRAGWWGFAATLDTERTLGRDGADWPVTLVTSYWVQTRNFP